MEAVVDTPVGAPEITITPAAIRRVRLLIAKSGIESPSLRLGVKGGGCSGLSYAMTLTPDRRPGDFAFQIEDIPVLVDPKSAQFLDGIVLDYTVENLLEGGWKWTNPNAARSCGCGTSFTPR